MKRHLALILLFLVSPALVFAGALPLSELITAADDYWRTSTPQRPVLIQGGQINSAQQYIPIPLSATPALVGYAMGAGALGGLAFYQQTGKDPVMAILDGIHHVFKPAFLAFQENFVSPESFPAAAAQFVGVESAIGATLSDIYGYVASNVGLYPSLDNVISSNNITGIPTVPRDLNKDDRIDTPSGVQFITQVWQRFEFGTFYSGIIAKISAATGGGTPSKIGVTADFTDEYYLSGNYIVKVDNIRSSNGYTVCDLYRASIAPVTGDPVPEFLPGELNEPALADALDNSPDPQVNQDLADVISQLPAPQVQIAVNVPPVGSAQDLAHPSISPQALEQFFAQNSAQVANKALETINDPAATPQEIAAAQAASNAAAQTAQQADSLTEPPPETYSDVPLSGFEEPYNPGPFDIPDRFDTFLANVAGTGLFSLPSQYFNSLPGGGSPVYTVEAGSYGTHTIDLSETMGTGLAVLKTVLLLCFAFLSVRVVVLKR